MTDVPALTREIFAEAPWAAQDRAALGAAARVPTMLQEIEQLLYLWLGEHWALGVGDIVDLGAFVGGSGAALAQGVARAGRKTSVHLYDRFTANETTKTKLLYSKGVEPFEGRNTLPLAQDMLAPWHDIVHLHPGDLMEQRWNDRPVEVLVVDIAKSVDLADFIAATWFPALMSERSIIVHQDFLHDLQPWLPAQMEMFADSFLPLAQVGRDSMAFLCQRPPTPTEIAARRLALRDDAALIDLLRRAQARFAPWGASARIAAMAELVRAHPGYRSAATLRKAAGRGWG